MNANHCICPLTLVIAQDDTKYRHEYKDKRGLVVSRRQIEACLQLTRHRLPDPTFSNVLTSSIEIYLRRLISHCALKVYVPSFADPEFHSPTKIKQLLTPSVRSHLVFADRRAALWQAVEEFFSPIKETALDTNYNILNDLAWAFYLLILASRYHGEAVVSVEKFLRDAAQVDKDASLSREARARLSRMCGIFRLFNNHEAVPCLRFYADVGPKAVTDRVNEILEDAYLLNASQLRRIIGLKQNVASVKRDLRLLLNTICKNSSWAKGLVSLSSTTLFGGDSAKRVLNSLLEIIPALDSQGSQPVLIPKDININTDEEGTISMVRTISGNDWVFNCKRIQT